MLLQKRVRFWKSGFAVISTMMLLCISGCNDKPSEESWVAENERETQVSSQRIQDKGYDLPIDETERKEAESDCKKTMESISDIYECADKGEMTNVILDKETIQKMKERMKQKGYSFTTMEAYSNIENYGKVDGFLKECRKGKSGSVVFYELHSDGGIGREKFIFDGKDMYFLETNAIWNKENEPGISYISYTRIKEWEYTNEGWLCYEFCVPEPPEVTEVVNGNCMVRITPMASKQREMSEKCVQGIGYMGNNLLCSNWDTEHMEQLDYNGLYEYLYAMKYKRAFQPKDDLNGIPKEEFERLMMEYLPVTAKQVREYAVFDEEKQTYAWERLGCLNYAPNSFGTSLPEVTDIKENEDGTVTLTVNAVCDMMMCEDAVITHELMVKFAGDGSFKYLGNKILDDGIKSIPDYQYRIPKFENPTE